MLADTPNVPQKRPRLDGYAVLIAEDDEQLAKTLETRCREIGFRVETAKDALRTLLKVIKDKPDLLILDLSLPDADGFKVVERLTDPKFPPLSVIVLTERSEEAIAKRCEELHVPCVQKGPHSWQELETIIFRTFQERKRTAIPLTETEESKKPAPRVLLVDDDPIVLKGLARGLAKYGLDVLSAPNGTKAFWLALKEQPDVVITDYNMEEGSGRYLLTRMKSMPSTQNIPIIVFTGTRLTSGQHAAMLRDLRGRGQAAAFLTKDIGVPALIAELRKHIYLPTPA